MGDLLQDEIEATKIPVQSGILGCTSRPDKIPKINMIIDKYGWQKPASAENPTGTEDKTYYR